MKNNFVAKGEYNTKDLKRYHDTRYYKTTAYEIKNMEFMQEEKVRLKTEKRKNVTEKIKEILNNKNIINKGKVFKILSKIKDKNEKFAFNKKNKKIPINSNLLDLLADVSMLTVAYAKVRKNPGASTEAYEMPNKEYDKLNAEQKSWVNKTYDSPDGITKEVILITSKLIKKNMYPWGTSRRIYVGKPGKKDAKRPITIPPFMDKVVQEAIVMILMSIYEPYFEAANCSFGFRPNKGVHDAIIALTNAHSIGMKRALEGDIKSAYDKANKEKLINILGKKIKDKKFLEFLKSRLNYEYYDIVEKKYVKPTEGLPQGGIDSPYLWNIYMLEFDEYITDHLEQDLDKINKKRRGRLSNSTKMIPFNEKRKIDRKITTLRKVKELIKITSKEKGKDQTIKYLEELKLKTAKDLIKEGIFTGDIPGLKNIFKDIGIGSTKSISKIIRQIHTKEKEWKKLGHKLPSSDPNSILWRFIYVRYADDWIILTNAKKYYLAKIKENINTYLKDVLSATLSLEKTLMTDLTKDSAHFLGYEISTYKGKKIDTYQKKIKGKKIGINAITAGSKVFATPDRQRLIERLYMKGYCTRSGFPREIGYISCLDDFSIIERYNSVLIGFALYYCEFVRNPKRNLTRWIYIIRFSCLKTLAQKHKTNIRNIFKQYKAPRQINSKSKTDTIKIDLRNVIDGVTYKKTWTLYTPEMVIKKALSLKRKEKLTDIYWQLKKDKKPVIYNSEEKKRITNDNFCEKINWTNIRTSASFDLPCALCGSEEDIEMHHINHVRKNTYNIIDTNKTWLQAMSLRNRKQIPVCRECHVNIIHPGKYGGIKLNTFVPKIMYDNRIITIESSINKAAINKKEQENYTKTLQEKGWKKEF